MPAWAILPSGSAILAPDIFSVPWVAGFFQGDKIGRGAVANRVLSVTVTGMAPKKDSSFREVANLRRKVW
jgi:hypothetical protein